VTDEPEVRRGLVAPDLTEEHPGLWLAWTDVAAAPGRTPPELRERLRALADRMRGAHAIALRSRDVPHAYRVFFRHVGLDPDVVRTPVEEVALRRMADGGLRPLGLIEDALTVAVLETGVGVLALDADRLTGAPGLRVGTGGRIVLADEAGELAILFGAIGERAALSRATHRVALVAAGVPNVPDVFVEEALWTAWDILR
jgi:DNA/RNA-binding domain of Phe-tRNA-synthetase-like protein